MKTGNFTTVLAEGASPLADGVLAALEQVPVLGMAVGLLKVADDIRNRAFEAKLRSFVDGLDGKTAEEIDLMAAEASSPEEMTGVGETLFLTLDRYTALGKCRLLGTVFLAFLEKKITDKHFRRIAQGIDIAFDDDLADFLSTRAFDHFSHKPFLETLVPTGLTRFVPAETKKSLIKSHFDAAHYEITDIGLQLILIAATPEAQSEAQRRLNWRKRPFTVGPVQANPSPASE